ncbi:MAG: hypothetical protein AAGB00_10110 [Planctomycetota bacterium]
MPNHLDLPDDLNRLIEKRSGEDRRAEESEQVRNDRRLAERRGEDADAPGDQGSDQIAEP